MSAQTSQQVAGPGGWRSSQQVKPRPLPGWLVVAVPVIAELLLGGYRISGPSFWRDEAATISGSNRSLGAIWALTSHQDAVHGLYYLLMHAVIAVAGTSETALRLPSLIAMALAAGLTAVLGRRLAAGAGRPAPGVVGMVAGLLLAVVPLTTRYAQEARPYALTTLFAVAATYLLVRAAPSRRWWWWAAYAAAIVVTGLFNLFALLLLVAHGLTLVAARPSSGSTKPFPVPVPTPARAPADTTASVTTSASQSPPAAPASTASAPARESAPHPVTAATPTTTSAPARPSASAATQTPSVAVGGPAGAGAGVSPAAGPGGTGSGGTGPGGPILANGALARWLIACGAAGVLLAPVAVLSVRQSGQLNWVTRPDLSTVATLVRDFAGLTLLIPIVALLAMLGCVAGPGLRRGAGLTLAVVAVPWLVVPPVLLLVISLADPLYVERYVMFCLPALSLLAATGLVWLVELTRRSVAARDWPVGRERLLSIVPSAALAIVILVALVSPQRAIRLPTARVDNLRAVAAAVAARERPGDAILYQPWDAALVGLAYPAPFAKLRNIGEASSPIASATLRGLPASPSVITARLRTAPRVWTVQRIPPTPSANRLTRTLSTAGLHLIHRWHIQSVQLTLYARAR